MSQALLAGVEQIVGSGTLVEHCKQNALRHIGLTEHGRHVSYNWNTVFVKNFSRVMFAKCELWHVLMGHGA
jgi:hypothetical protein